MNKTYIKVQTILDNYKDFIINSEEDYNEPDYLLEQDGRKFAPRGNLVLIKGKVKQGKNLAQLIIVASVLGCNMYGLKSLLYSSEKKVVVMDTDQHSFYTWRMKKRTQVLMGWNTKENQPELVFINARTMSPEERMNCVRKTITEMQPDVFILDNAAHVESNFNDPVSSRAFVDELVRLADENDCLLIVVMHENKSATDTNAKGHLGSFLYEAANDVFEIKKEGTQHHINHVIARDRNIEPITFVINDDGLPQLAKAAAQEKKEQKEYEKKVQRDKAFTEILDGGLLLSYTELASAYRDKMNCGNTKAYEDIKLAISEEVIITNAEKKYSLNDMPY